MINIDSSIFIIQKFVSWLLFFYIFKFLYRPKHFYSLIILFIPTILSAIFINQFTYFIVAALIFGVFFQEKRLMFLINTIVFSSLIHLLTEIVANASIIILFPNNFANTSLMEKIISVSSNILIQLIISVIFIFIYNYFKLENFLKIKSSGLFGLLIGYLFVVIYTFMQIIQNTQAYSDLISGILLFILIQCTFIVIIFLKGYQTQNEAYTRELTKEQLKNLKMYTDQLEHEQIKLRGFERNYKGTINHLRSIAQSRDFEAMNHSLITLEDYSNSYFDNISMQLFKDLNNVSNPYLKSLLISKLTIINQNNINCHFECRDVVNDISINIFDLIRLLGISFDNALEATKYQPHGEIRVAIIQEKQQLSFIINNTTTDKTDVSEMMQEGFTTKKHHSGLGLVNIQDIKKKYPNLFVQYRKNEQWFNLNIVIIK